MSHQDLQSVRRVWDREAATFDAEPDHGLRDSRIRKAWESNLVNRLASTSTGPLKVLDVGCGTGSLSVLLARLGHEVIGIDVSPAMLAEAKVKAAASATGPCLQFHVMDAANLSFASQQFDVILCRHLLWALPFPDQVLRHWADLLKPAGRLLLIEGYWHTGAGLPSREVVKALPPIFTDVKTENLSAHTELWGKPVTDERYIVIAALPASV